uniref:Uncharacterized protein n=1 Tax=Rhizophora mucronata TaxID=61149 RepID=A0A2P2QTV8_RHIMU
MGMLTAFPRTQLFLGSIWWSKQSGNSHCLLYTSSSTDQIFYCCLFHILSFLA